MGRKEAKVWMSDFCGISKWGKRQVEVPKDLAATVLGLHQAGMGPARRDVAP